MAAGDYFVNGILVRSDGAVYTTTTANMADLADTSDATKGDALLGVKHTGTGAVGRTQHAKNLERVSFYDFMTAAQISDAQAGTALVDATDAIANAIASGAKEVEGYGGDTYSVTGTFTIPAGVRVVAKGGTKPVLKFTAASEPTDTSTRAAIVLAGSGSEIIGFDIQINGGDYRRTISAGGADRQKINYNKITVNTSEVDAASQHFAIFSSHASTASNHSEIVGNEITGTINRPTDGIQLSKFRHGLVTDNYIHDITATGGTQNNWAIYCSDQCYGTVVERNRIVTVTQSGIHLSNLTTGAASDYGRAVRDNYLSDVDFVGIAAEDTNRAVIEVNTLSTINLPISITGSLRTRVVGNDISTVDDGGSAISANLPMIEIDSTSSDVVVSENVFGARGDALRGVFSDGPRTICSKNRCLTTGPVTAIQCSGTATDSIVSENEFQLPDDTTNSQRVYLQGARSRAVNNTVVAVAAAGKIGIRLGAANCYAAGNNVIGGVNCIWVDSSSSTCMVRQNILASASSANIANTGTNNTIRDNAGWVTENSGTGSIASGATTATVTHGLAVTPTLDDISITFGEQGTNDYGRFWIDTITSTQFRVNVSADPGASNLDFGWRAECL